jgi:topoisomerase IV subunit A
MGIHVNTVANMTGDEHLIGAFIVHDFNQTQQQILLTTKNGLIKRTPMFDFVPKNFARGFKAMRLENNDEIVSATLVSQQTTNVVVISQSGFGVIYNLEDVPVQGAAAKGVKAISVKKEVLVGGYSLKPGDHVLIFTNKSKYKRLDATQIPTFVRPKKGVRLYPERKRGQESIIFAFVVVKEDTLYLLDAKNQYHEFELKKTKKQGLNEPLTDLGLKNLVYAGLEKGQIVQTTELGTSVDNHFTTDLEQMNPQPVVSETKPKLETSKVVVKTSDKKAAAKKVEATSTGLADLLNDINAILKKAKPESEKPKPTKKKTSKKKTDEEEIQFDFEDLLDDQ